MISGLKIEFMEYSVIPDLCSQLVINDSCICYWLDGGDQVLVVPKNPNGLTGNIAISISFDFKKCLDPDGGHEWLENKLRKLIAFLVKNKTHFLN
jgi:hypothetical protein